MAYVTVINEHQHVQQIVSGHHHMTADATASAGGSDAGFAPRELLLASLGACTAIALRKHAVSNDWSLGRPHSERSLPRKRSKESKLSISGLWPPSSSAQRIHIGMRLRWSNTRTSVRSAKYVVAGSRGRSSRYSSAQCFSN
jgi:hypothetical protein